MTFNNELSKREIRVKWKHYIIYSVSHSTENWRVLNACHPMRIKATTTGLQGADRDRDREKEGSIEEATQCRGKKKTYCAPAGLLSPDWQKQARIFNTVQLCYLSCLDQEEEEESWSKELHVWSCVCLTPVWSVTHTLSIMHTCELQSSVMSQTFHLWLKCGPELPRVQVLQRHFIAKLVLVQ